MLTGLLSVRAATRSRADRDRGLAAISALPGLIGRFVIGRNRAAHAGGGGVCLPVCIAGGLPLMNRFTIRSSSE